MKNAWTVVALSLALFGIAGCGPKKPTLHLYTWSDYIDPDLVASFEKANQCRVKIDTFDSNETMYAKVLAGSSRYDIIFPSSYQVSLMSERGMLLPLDKSKLPNVAAHFDETYKGVILNPEMTYNVPYAITFTGIAYRKDKVGGAEISWASFDDPAFKGRSSLLNDFRETIGAALKSLGYSLNSTNSTELQQACEVVVRWKKNIAKFENEQYKTGIAAGEFLLVHGYSGDIGQVQIEDENVGFFLPKEGFSLCCDEMVIPKDAPNKDLAYKFINFLHDGKVAAQNMIYTTYWCPNTAAVDFLPDEVKNNPTIFPKKEDLKRGEVIGYLGPALALYTRTWDEIKAAK